MPCLCIARYIEALNYDCAIESSQMLKIYELQKWILHQFFLPFLSMQYNRQQNRRCESP